MIEYIDGYEIGYPDDVEDDPAVLRQRMIEAHRWRLTQKQALINMRDWDIPRTEIGRVLAAPGFYITDEQRGFIELQIPPLLEQDDDHPSATAVILSSEPIGWVASNVE